MRLPGDAGAVLVDAVLFVVVCLTFIADCFIADFFIADFFIADFFIADFFIADFFMAFAMLGGACESGGAGLRVCLSVAALHRTDSQGVSPRNLHQTCAASGVYER
jgi:hypothetical protein